MQTKPSVQLAMHNHPNFLQDKKGLPIVIGVHPVALAEHLVPQFSSNVMIFRFESISSSCAKTM